MKNPNVVQQVRTAYARLEARERRAVKLLVWTLGLALAAQAVWSLETARRAYVRERSAQAARAEQARALADAWQRLRETPAAPRSAASLRAEVQGRLAELGPRVSAEWTGSGELRLRGEVVFARWLEWTGRLHEEQRLVLQRCRITPAGERATIDAQFIDAAAP